MCETAVLFDLSITVTINSNDFEVVILSTYLYLFLLSLWTHLLSVNHEDRVLCEKL
jgi:hypothetical protein